MKQNKLIAPVDRSRGAVIVCVMEANDFCYWLQGFFEMSGAKTLDEKQVEQLKKHLGLVMVNVVGDCSEEASKAVKTTPRRPGVNLLPSDRKIC